ncbi:MAG: tetratricopeptide repeat protein [Methanolobus sp.]
MSLENEEAIVCYEKVLQINPTHSVARFQLYANQALLEDGNSSISCYIGSGTLGVLNTDVFDSEMFVWSSDSLLYGVAGIADSELIGDTVSYDQVWVSRGSCYENMSIYDNATDSYEMAILLNPESAIAWNGMASSYDVLGNYADAVYCYNRAVLLDPDNTEIWFKKGLSHLKNMDDQSAIESFGQVLKREPANTDALFTGRLLMITSDNMRNHLNCISRYWILMQIMQKYGIVQAVQHITWRIMNIP